jgi:hypothetical protein
MLIAAGLREWRGTGHPVQTLRLSGTAFGRHSETDRQPKGSQCIFRTLPCRTG